MIKSFFFTFVLVSLTVYCAAQKQRSFAAENQIVYKVAFKPDSTDQDNVVIEYAELLANDTSSIFRTISQGKTDSALYAQYGLGNSKGQNQSRTRMHFTIVKQKDSVYTYDTIYDSFALYAMYGESRNDMKWSIEKDTMNHNGINCQKAKLVYGGRNWTAWFSIDIPFPDGPYKFTGLPGLIIYMYDSANQWIFDLAFINPKYDKKVFYGDVRFKYKHLSKDDFHRERKRLKNNTFELSSALGLNDGVTGDTLEKLKKFYKEKAKKDNNGIELYN